MNSFFKNRPRITVINEGRHKHGVRVAVMRKCAVFIPIMLISAQSVFGFDGRSKCQDSLCVRSKSIAEKGAGVRPIMIGAVAPGFLKERESGLKCNAQLCAGSNSSGTALSPKLKTVISDDGEKCASKSYECNEYRDFYDWLLTGSSVALIFFGTWISWPHDKKHNVIYTAKPAG